MDAATKTKLKTQITTMSAMNSAFKSAMSMQPPPVMGGMPPMPIILQPALAPYLAALKTHADEYEKLLKMLDELVAKL